MEEISFVSYHYRYRNASECEFFKVLSWPVGVDYILAVWYSTKIKHSST